MSVYLTDLAKQHGCSLQEIIDLQSRWESLTADISFSDWLAQGQRGGVGASEPAVEKLAIEPTPGGGFRVKNETARARTVQQLINVLCAQPVGSVSEKLLEVAGGVFALQQENAHLRMENARKSAEIEELRMELRARGGAELP